MEHVFGYTVANDLTASDIFYATKNGNQHLLAKSLDNFCPLFSDIVTKVNSFSFILFYVLQRIEVTRFKLQTTYSLRENRFFMTAFLKIAKFFNVFFSLTMFKVGI